MISRVADNCFWFGRYLDRAESSARLLQATRTLVFDADMPVVHCWPPLVIVSGEEEPFVERYGREALGNGEAVQEYMTWNRGNLVSLGHSVRAARDSARGLRDKLSLDVWEEVNELYLWLGRESTRKLYTDDREEFYRGVRRSTQLILGLVRSTMLHEEPMRFLWLGVMLERVGQTARILDMHHHTMEREAAHDIVGTALWMSLLRACSASDAFMKKNQERVTAGAMVSFILFAPHFPRSLRYCLGSAADLLERIWPGAEGRACASIARTAALRGWLRQQQAGFDVTQIHGLLTHVVDEIAAICVAVGQEIQGPQSVASRASPAPPASEARGEGDLAQHEA